MGIKPFTGIYTSEVELGTSSQSLNSLAVNVKEGQRGKCVESLKYSTWNKPKTMINKIRKEKKIKR